VVESTPLEYWLATTDPVILKLWRIIKKKIPTFQALLRSLRLSELYPNGAQKLILEEK